MNLVELRNSIRPGRAGKALHAGFALPAPALSWADAANRAKLGSGFGSEQIGTRKRPQAHFQFCSELLFELEQLGKQ